MGVEISHVEARYVLNEYLQEMRWTDVIVGACFLYLAGKVVVVFAGRNGDSAD